MGVHRRDLMALGVAALAAPPLAARAAADAGAGIGLKEAVAKFGALPATASCLVSVDTPTAPIRVGHDPARHLFVGSAVKTFILAQYLRAAEAGRLSETDQVAVDDSVRSLSSPVFLKLSGTTQARSALEAMIAHSDNTATDIALAQAGVADVRALIAEAGLTATQIPESTRRLFSYLAGAPEGVDVGWKGMQRMMADQQAGTPRDPLNDHQTMTSSAEDLVSWYQRALRGTYFKKPDTLLEFKRIQAMADALALVVPSGVAAYGKGGSIDWKDFHCFSLAGQMVVGKVPVTFCFTVNWTGSDESVTTVFGGFRASVTKVLAEATLAAA